MFIVNTTTLALVDHKEAFPNVCFPASGVPDDYLAENGYAHINQWKPYDNTTQKLVSSSPYQEEGEWYTVEVVALSAEELEVAAAAKVAKVKQEITDATSARLDAFAQTRNYDSILSACTYASSTVAQFAQEGQLCVNLRDATWGKLYQIMQEVEADTRPMPASYADIEAELPELAWA